MEKEVLLFELPNEMLFKIFHYLRKKHLLNCRLVSTRFQTIASFVSREKRMLPKIQIRENSEFFSVFLTSKDIPWACVAFRLLDGAVQFQIQNGMNIHQLLILGHYMHTLLESWVKSEPDKVSSKYLLVLPEMHPSSTKFKSSRNHSWTCDFHFQFNLLLPNRFSCYPSDKNAQGLILNTLAERLPNFPQISKLYFPLTGESSLDLLKLMKNCFGHELKKVHLNCSAADPLITSEGIALIHKIPNISLEFQYNSRGLHTSRSPPRLTGGVKVNKLAFYIHHPMTFYKTYYAPLASLLEENGQHLEKLWLCSCKTQRNMPKVRFLIPPLPKLKTLTLVVEKDEVVTWRILHQSPPSPEDLVEFGFPFLSHFQPNTFPSLRKVVLVDPQQVFAFDSFPVESVEEFVLSSRRGYIPNLTDGHWNKVFPKLTTLVTTVDLDNLLYILCHMKNLVSLDLHVGMPSSSYGMDMVDEADPNFVLSGIREPSKSACLPAGEIQKLIESSALPSLRWLKQLKTLRLAFFRPTCQDCESQIFNDSGIILSILQLPPLDVLTLSDVQVSVGCEEKLRSNHKQCEIDDNLMPAKFDSCEYRIHPTKAEHPIMVYNSYIEPHLQNVSHFY